MNCIRFMCRVALIETIKLIMQKILLLGKEVLHLPTPLKLQAQSNLTPAQSSPKRQLILPAILLKNKH